MFRKLLFTCLTVFAFTAVNAQALFVTQTPGCGSVYEFEYDSAADVNNEINGKKAYRRLLTATGNFDGLFGIPNASNAANTEVGVQWFGGQWVYFWNNDPAQALFTNSSTDVLPPEGGWVDTGVIPCGGTFVLSLYTNIGGVLPVSREEFSDIKIYPNPSTGFINISNLKENSRVVISNITGQIVKDVVVGMNDNRIDIQDLSQGFYFVELEGMKTIKLIKR